MIFCNIVKNVCTQHDYFPRASSCIHTQIKREVIDIDRILRGVSEGARDMSAIRLASWYHLQGKTKEETLELMLEWNTRNKPPLKEKTIEQKVESAWRPEKPYSYRFAQKKASVKIKFTSREKNLCVGSLFDGYW